MRCVLYNLYYPYKDARVFGIPDPYIVGPPEVVYEHEEVPESPGRIER